MLFINNYNTQAPGAAGEAGPRTHAGIMLCLWMCASLSETVLGEELFLTQLLPWEVNPNDSLCQFLQGLHGSASVGGRRRQERCPIRSRRSPTITQETKALGGVETLAPGGLGVGGRGTRILFSGAS